MRSSRPSSVSPMAAAAILPKRRYLLVLAMLLLGICMVAQYGWQTSAWLKQQNSVTAPVTTGPLVSDMPLPSEGIAANDGKVTGGFDVAEVERLLVLKTEFVSEISEKNTRVVETASKPGKEDDEYGGAHDTENDAAESLTLQADPQVQLQEMSSGSSLGHSPISVLHLDGHTNFKVITNLTHEMIVRNQFVADCSRRHFVIAGLATQGMMYNFLWLQDVFAYALLTNRTMLIYNWRRLWSYSRDRDYCGEETWHCYFDRLSNCPLPSLHSYECWNAPNAKDAQVVVVGRTPKRRCGFFVPHYLPTIRSEVFKLDYGSRCQFVHFLFRPNARTQRHINSVRAAAFPSLNQPYHAIHIRVGDKHVENSPKEVYRYFRQLRMLAPTTPAIKTVFVSTDEPTVIEQLDGVRGEFQVVVNPLEERLSGGQWTQTRLHGSVNATRHALNFIANVYLISKAVYFVGTQSSNVGNMVLWLLCANRGSTNWPGCFANTLDGIKFASANHAMLDGPAWNQRKPCKVTRFQVLNQTISTVPSDS